MIGETRANRVRGTRGLSNFSKEEAMEFHLTRIEPGTNNDRNVVANQNINLPNGSRPSPAKGSTVWLTGLSGAGKTTIARLLEERLRARGATVEVLDGDIVRTRLSKGLGYSKEDRNENIRRIGFVCELLSRNGVIAIVAAISPYRSVRQEVRSHIRNFVEVFVDCPLDVLVRRDAKGLYKKALAGEIPNFTGVSDPYEPPLAPEVTVDSSIQTPEQSVARILVALETLDLIAATGPRFIAEHI